MKISAAIGRLQDRLNALGDQEIAMHLFTANDVIDRAIEREITEPTREQAYKILARMERNLDCAQGMTWDQMDGVTDTLYPELYQGDTDAEEQEARNCLEDDDGFHGDEDSKP